MANKILLVDDSRDLLDAYVEFLQALTAYDVRGVASGHAALEVARNWRPDVVVTDIMMPDMNGLDLITHMRSELPPPLPIIVAMSGFPDVEEEARHRGAEVFYPKPLDPEHLVTLIDSLLADREPPAHVRAASDARRQQASALAESAVAATLGRQPYFAQVAQLGARLLSWYFDGADAALLLIGDGHLKVFASSGWPVGAQPDGVVGYALDVVVSGSTLIVPDLRAMPTGCVRSTLPEWRLLAAVPVRPVDGMPIGALMVADHRAVAFDVNDLGILQHIAARLADVFSGTVGGAGLLEAAGILRAESWRHLFGCELPHLGRGQTLVVGLASSAVTPTIPVRSREAMERVERATNEIIARLPARTALGRLTPDRVAAYSVVQDPVAGARALISVFESLEEQSHRASIAIMTATDLCPTDGGAALLEILQCLLRSAMARGPATILGAHIAPAAIDRPRAA
jgi:CheY-like chemotaxis protein